MLRLWLFPAIPVSVAGRVAGRELLPKSDPHLVVYDNTTTRAVRANLKSTNAYGLNKAFEEFLDKKVNLNDAAREAHEGRDPCTS